MIKVHAVSLGCPKNRVDTEMLLGGLATADGAGGVLAVENPAEADVVLINTCGFIRPAVEESVSTILDAASAIAGASADVTCKALADALPANASGDVPENEPGDEPEQRAAGVRSGKRKILAVAGCLVSRYGAAELAAELPEVDVWLTTGEMDQWPERISRALGMEISAGTRLRSTPPSYAYLKVAEGCGHKCAFCTIPAIRGPLRSAPMDKLLGEAAELVGGGVRELVLVAQDLTSYGKDFTSHGKDRATLGSGGAEGMIELIEGLMRTEGLDWLRLMYLYPAGLTDRVLDFLAANCAKPLGGDGADGVRAGVGGSPLLPYFDVPLQHAHPDILARMGRPFARDPRRVLDRIREAVPHAVLRTSIITGFPGETDEHFQTLKEFVRQARFTHLGVFAFEREEGTAAHGMDGQVAREVAEARRDELMALQAVISEDFLADFEGCELDVLVDAEHDEWPGLHVGRTWFQAPEVDGTVYVSGEKIEPGQMVACSIEEAKTYDLVALAG